MKLSAAINAIQSAVNRLGITAGVSASKIKLLAEVGFFLIQLNKVDSLSADDNSTVLEEALLHFFKNKVDQASVAEFLAKDFYKALKDNALLSEHVVWDFFKNVKDTTSVSEHARRDFSKVIADRVNLTDDIDGQATTMDDQEISFYKSLSRIATVTDNFYRVVAYARSFIDSATISDKQTTDFYKITNDTAGVVDTVRRDGTKALVESPVVRELISKEVGRPLSDAFTTTDTFTKSPGLVKAETTSVSDTGSLRSQGYCDFSYFEEDFVGASRTF